MTVFYENSRATFSLPNDVYGDPLIYTFFKQSGEAVLFDLGSCEKLSNKELVKVTHAFVSHAHMDHFIGFDRLLRVKVPHGCKLNIYGPEGFIKNVQGKLRGYLWNLLEVGQLQVTVREISSDGQLKSAILAPENDFEAVYFDLEIDSEGASQPHFPAVRIARLRDGCMVDAVILDHGTPVLAYCTTSPLIYSLNTTALEEIGLKPGPWVSQLQSALLNQNNHKKLPSVFEIEGKKFDINFLVENVFSTTCTRIFAYATDLIFSDHNVDRLRLLAEGVELLACESSFLEKDEKRATVKKHLTDVQAKKIAEVLNTTTLKTFHYSKIYSSSPISSKN